MKKSFIGLISSCLLSFSFAVNAAAVDELKSKLSEHNALSASFSQVVKRSSGDVLSKSSGNLSLKKPDSMMLHTTAPDEQVLFTKGKDVYFFDPFVNQVSIFNKRDLYSSPFLLLTSTSDKIWNQYKVEASGDVYTLTPVKKGEVSLIKVAFSAGTISSISITMKDGNTNTYTLSGVGYSVSDSAFSYSIPQDAQIDDERKSN